MTADTPSAPYYAVIFTSLRTGDDQGYAAAADRMVELAREQPGFLGVESARGNDGLGITVSYWISEEAILAWKQHPEHREIRERGRSTWYAQCHTRVCRVDRAYGFTQNL
jgi:heme-degrading monooxygenase HmoA